MNHFKCCRQYRCNVEINIGVAHFPLDSESAEDLMKYADLAAFTVKERAKELFSFILPNSKSSYVNETSWKRR